MHISLLSLRVPDPEWEYQIIAGQNGGSHIDFTLHRVGKSLKGYIITILLSVFGKRIFRQDLDQTLQRLAEIVAKEIPP